MIFQRHQKEVRLIEEKKLAEQENKKGKCYKELNMKHSIYEDHILDQPIN